MTHPTDEEGPPLRKIKDVARRLTMSERQIYHLIDRGELEAVHEGRSVFVTASSERDYVERLRQRAAARRAAKAAEAKSKAARGGTGVKTASGPPQATLKAPAET
jgi:hypothetical protein